MAGWIVQIRTADQHGERVTRWAAAHPDWTTAMQIASEAQGVDPAHRPPGLQVITIRARREALPEELAGLASGEARQVE